MMDTIYYLAQHFFMESVAAILAVMTVCGILLKRITGHQALRMVLYISIVLLLIFLFSFLTIKDDVNERAAGNSIGYYASPSETWTFEYVD